ncbi:MAG: hypothetical protein BGO55_11230 [Sphingobacteriales bacterium 50-39]|nr:MAG: hypothetical protein BGO55_11230 [Sphingobacteriales bacterium 50-39]
MTTVDIANRLYELCKEGHYQQAQEELLADDALSIEPVHANEKGVPSVTGKDAIIKKGEQFQESIEELHGVGASQPIVAGNHFALTITVDATFKGMGKMVMEEVAVYEVRDGKVVKEQFFY